jgi:uncharacterized protein (TIGR03000 family)
MFKRLLAYAGGAVLAAGLGASPANAQHVQHSGGHAGSGGHAVAAPHATYVRPSNQFYRGHANYGYGGRANYAYGGHANYGSRYGGYAYRYPNYGYSRYGYPYYRYGVGLGLGYPYYYNNYGYGYPYSYGYSYPDYGSYYVPSYGAADAFPPAASTSAYPPAESAPPPATAGSAHLTVQLPADARLWIDGQPTVQTGAVRTFETPANLDPARGYSYLLRAEWVENGQPVARERRVDFQAGGQVVVNMTVS